MKPVGIVSCYFKYNYGSQLQAYALKRFLDNNNVPNETINVDCLKDFSKGKKKYYLTQMFNIPLIRAKFGMVKLKFYKKINSQLGKNIAIRTKKYNDFIKESYNLSVGCHTYDELNKLTADRYSNVIVGSDQLWLPVNIVADYYTLNWVPDNVNKISYSTSFGVSSIPKKYNELYKKYLNRIDYLSIREEHGIKLAKDLIGKDAELVCDPTILLSREQWNEMVPKERIIEDKYILCYFLGNSVEHRKFAEKLRARTGYKIVSLNHADEYVKYSDVFCDIAPYDIGPKEWINLIENAEYVLTDSFHCTVFSLLYNKNFFTFRRYKSKNNSISTNSRIDSLLGVVNLEDRILDGWENVDDFINRTIDFKKVNLELEKFRESSAEWLLNSIQHDEEENLTKYIEIRDKSKCSGCTACMSVCPKGAIKMVRDDEGFLYPKVDKSKCINCGLCRKTCPILNKQLNEFTQVAYIANNKNDDVRSDSTSGGAFTPIAEYVLDNNGVVFGAMFDDNFNVFHGFIDNKSDLYKLRGSKYVQSDIKDCFKQVLQFLKRDKMVCFSGTPCQVEGLRSFLNKDYENLIMVDIMCHSVPSPLFWEKYKSYIAAKELKGEHIESVKFRDKSKYGYKYPTMTIKGDSKSYSRGVESDPYLMAFFGDLSVRPSCFNCNFKKQCHISDFTIWDCFIVEKFDNSLDDNKGTSRILINSPKGIKIFNTIKEKFNYTEVSTEKLVKNVKEMLYSVEENVNRDDFFYDLKTMEEKSFFKKWFSETIKIKLERALRIFLAKTGLYTFVRNIVKKK